VGPNARLYLSAGYHHSSDSFLDGETGIENHTTTDGQTGRLLFDAIPPKIEGFLRAAIWEEAAWLNGDAYQRVVLRAAYEKEIPIAPNQPSDWKSWQAPDRHSVTCRRMRDFSAATRPANFSTTAPPRRVS